MPKKRSDRKQSRQENANPNPQRFRWNVVSKHDSFDKADGERNKLKKSGRNVKVRARKDGFRVVEGTPIKKAEG